MLSIRLNITGELSCHTRLKSWAATNLRTRLQRSFETKLLISITSRWVKAEATLIRVFAAQSQKQSQDTTMTAPVAQQINRLRSADMANCYSAMASRLSQPEILPSLDA
jgi:hypothetical protein